MHLGERIDPGDYLWPDEFTPFDGLKAESVGQRWAPRLQYWQPTPIIEGKLAPRGSESIVTLNDRRAANLSMLAPRWMPPKRRAPYQG